LGGKLSWQRKLVYIYVACKIFPIKQKYDAISVKKKLFRHSTKELPVFFVELVTSSSPAQCWYIQQVN
jgi:hypothetical protein